MPDNLTKIRFNLDPEDWHGIPAELLWAEPIGPEGSRAFRLMNSPYYARGVSYLDVVRADDAPDGLGLDYAGTVEPSGHSTVWLLTTPGSTEFARHLERLRSKGTTHEALILNPRQTLYSVDVPPETDFDEVLSVLDEGHRAGVWRWQVPHEGHGSAPSSTPSGTA